MSDFVIVVRELEQSCGNGLPSELAPSADIDALLTYFDRPAALAGAGPAAPAAAPAPPAPAEAGPPAPAPAEAGPPAPAPAEAGPPAPAPAEAGPPAPAPAEAGPPAPPVPAVDDAAEAARALADAEAAAKELQAAAEAAAAADAAAAAQAAADAAEAARLSDEAAAAVAAALFRDAALLEARGGIDESIDTTFIDQMGNRPGPEARPKDAAAKQALRNFYDTDEEDTEEPRPVPAKKSADFPDAEPAAHVKRVIYQIEQKIAKQKADDIARSRADAAMENAAKAKAYAEFEKRDAEGEYATMSSDEKALVRVKMAIAQSNKDYYEREAAELKKLEEKEAKRARKNGNAAAAAGRGAPKPSGRNAVTKAFRKDLREGQKSFTDDNTILPKTALRRLVRCQLDMLGKEGVCISNGMLEVLQLACAGEVGSFMASAFMNTVNHKRKTLMVKDFNDVVKIASDPSTHNIAKEMYHEGVRKANQAKRNRHADA